MLRQLHIVENVPNSNERLHEVSLRLEVLLVFLVDSYYLVIVMLEVQQRRMFLQQERIHLQPCYEGCLNLKQVCVDVCVKLRQY